MASLWSDDDIDYEDWAEFADKHLEVPFRKQDRQNTSTPILGRGDFAVLGRGALTSRDFNRFKKGKKLVVRFPGLGGGGPFGSPRKYQIDDV